jgi:hypothetical protein
VAVIRIRQTDRRDQVLVSGDEAVTSHSPCGALAPER